MALASPFPGRTIARSAVLLLLGWLAVLPLPGRPADGPDDALVEIEATADRLRRQGDREAEALQHYLEALEAWAASTRIEVARKRFLALVQEASGFSPGASPGPGLPLPGRIYREAWSLAQTERERSLTGFLLARHLLGGPARSTGEVDASRLETWFEAATQPDRDDPWGEAAHLLYAEWLMAQGRLVVDPEGGSRRAPDYARAIDQFRAYVRKARAGGGIPDPALIQAEQTIEHIQAPQLEVRGNRSYLPESEIALEVSWRNLETVELALYRVDPQAVRLTDPGAAEPLAAVGWDRGEPLFTVRLTTIPEAPHLPVEESVRFADPLPGGLYLAEARAGDRVARDLVPVTRAGLLVRRLVDGKRIQLVDTENGEPLPGQPVRLLWRAAGEGGSKGAWQLEELSADETGTARWLPGAEAKGRSLDYLILAGTTDRVAGARSTGQPPVAPLRREAWTVVAQQSHYRPGDTVHWEAWLSAQPENPTVLRPRLVDPDGKRVALPKPVLAGYGRVRGSFVLPDDRVRIGPYRFFWDSGLTPSGYPAPPLQPFFDVCPDVSSEVRLSVTEVARSREGEPPVLTVGLAGESESPIRLDGFSGRLWVQPVPARATSRAPDGHAVCRQVVAGRSPDGLGPLPFRLDAAGRASVQVPLATGDRFRPDQDPLLVLAGARDEQGAWALASRRIDPPAPVLTAGMVLDRPFGEPDQPVGLDLTTRLSDGRAVAVAGRLRILSRVWEETWVNDRGREITGRQYRELLRRGSLFRPFGGSPGDFSLVRSGYRSREVRAFSAETNLRGRLGLDLVLEEPGFYRLQWTGRLPGGQLVTAEEDILIGSVDDQALGWVPDTFTLALRKGPSGWRALVASPEEAGRVELAWIHAGGETRRTIRLAGHTRLVAQPDDLPDGPFRLVAWQWAQGRLRQTLVEAVPKHGAIGITVTAGDSGPDLPGSGLTLSAGDIPIRAWSAWLTREPVAEDDTGPRLARSDRLAGGFRPDRDSAASIHWKPFVTDPVGAPTSEPVAQPPDEPTVLQFPAPVPADGESVWLAPAAPPASGEAGAANAPVTIRLPPGAEQPGSTLHGLAYATDGRSALLHRRLVRPFPLELSLRYPDRVRAGDRPGLLLDLRHRGEEPVRAEIRSLGSKATPGARDLPESLEPGDRRRLVLPADRETVGLQVTVDNRSLTLPVAIGSLPEAEGLPVPRSWGTLPADGASWRGPGRLFLAGNPASALARLAALLEEPHAFSGPYVPPRAARILAGPGSGGDGALEALLAARNPAGGWGLYAREASDPVTTGLAYWALDRLQRASATEDPPHADRETAHRLARRYLTRLLLDPEQAPGMRVWLAFCLAAPPSELAVRTPTREEIDAFSVLWRRRDRGTAAAQALLAVVAARFGLETEATALAASAVSGFQAKPAAGQPWPVGADTGRVAGVDRREAAWTLPLDPATRDLATLWALHWLGRAGPTTLPIQQTGPGHPPVLASVFAGGLLARLPDGGGAEPLPDPSAFKLEAGVPLRVEGPWLAGPEPDGPDPVTVGPSDPSTEPGPWVLRYRLPERVAAPGLQVTQAMTVAVARPTLLRGIRVTSVDAGKVDTVGVDEPVRRRLTLVAAEPQRRVTVRWPLPGGAVRLGGEPFEPRLLAMGEGGASSERSLPPDDRRILADGTVEATWLRVPAGTWRVEDAWRYPAPGVYGVPEPQVIMDGRPVRQEGGPVPGQLKVTWRPAQTDGP